MRRRTALAAAAAALAPLHGARAQKDGGLVKAAGSSIVAGLLGPVIERFRAAQPRIEFDIGSAGSGTALPAMLESPATLGLLSRAVNARERERFREKYGYPPIELKVAIDAVAIYLFKDNPVASLTLADLRRAFGRGAEAATRWSDLGAAGVYGAQPLVRFGLEPGRGAYEVMRDLVLQGGEFAADVAIEPVSTSVVQGVATQPGGIGYASVFFRTQRTRIVPIAHEGRVAEPSAEDAASGRYPLARYLYVVVNRRPGTPPDAAQQQFLRFLLSADAQEIVARQGLYPIGEGQRREALALLGA